MQEAKVEDEKIVAEETQEEITSVESEESLPETEGVAVGDTQEEPEEVETPEEKPEGVETMGDSSLEKGEKIPFHKDPVFQKRISQIENKYGTDARMWQTIVEASENNPELRLSIVKELENRGKMPQGSYNALKKELEGALVGEDDKGTQIPDISELPEVKYARSLMLKEQMEKEAILQEFERNHPDIASYSNPVALRERIATLSKHFIEQGQDLASSLESAYGLLFGRDQAIEEARKKGELEGRIKADSKGVVANQSSSNVVPQTTLRKLTREEENARRLLGMDVPTYLKYLESDGSVEE